NGSGCGHRTAATSTTAPWRGRWEGATVRPSTLRGPTSVSGTPSDSTTWPREEEPSWSTRTWGPRLRGARKNRRSGEKRRTRAAFSMISACHAGRCRAGERGRDGPRPAGGADPAQRTEELPEVVEEQLRLLQRGEVAAPA